MVTIPPPRSLMVAALSVLGGFSAIAQVSSDRLLHAEREPQNWLTYSGSYTGQRYSPLTQITPENAKNLELQWVLQTRAPAEATGKYESTPLVVDGIMYSV